MFVAITTYLEPIGPDHPLLAPHREHLDREYERRTLVCSGPQSPRVGGVLVIRGDDEDDARAVMDADPLVAGNCVTYQLTRFTPTKGASPDLVEG